MKTLAQKYLATAALLLSVLLLQGQPFPIETNIALTPPYPTNLDAYVNFLEQGIVEVNNIGDAELEVYFDVRLEETNGKISITTNGILGTPISIPPGFNFLTPNQIQDIFSDLSDGDFNTAGLSQGEREAILLNRQMPEGSYRLCIQAFAEDASPLSDPTDDGCVFFDLFFAERPVITMPFDDEQIEAEGFLLLSWDHVINSPSALDRMEYTLKIIDLTEQEIENIPRAMLDPGISPDYEEELGSAYTANLQNDIDLPLIGGHRYAMRVTAVDPDGSIGFQFGGHSEIVIFTYGEAEAEEEEAEDGGLLAAPILITPEDGFINMLEDPLAIPLEWSHEVEEDSLKSKLTYSVKVIDMDSLKITSVDIQDFKDDTYAYVFNQQLPVDAGSDTSTTVLVSAVGNQLIRAHKYAVAVFVESEDDRLEWENDGYSDLIQFVIGEEKEEEDAEDACGGKCLASLPTDKTAAPIKIGDNLFMGNLMLTVDNVSKDALGGYKGEGSVFVNFIKQIHINVAFSQLEANSQKYVFAGSAKAKFDDSTVKMDGIVATAASTALNIDFEAAKALSNALRSTGKLASALAGKKTSLPLGFDRAVDGDTMVVGITEMDFTPTKATMTALFSISNPDWGDYVPTLGATDICFTREGFGEVVKLYLGEDYNIPMSNEQLVLKASENNASDEKGTYCIVDCNGFKEGQITGEIGIPREVLLPENEDGSIQEDGYAKLTVSGLFTKGSGFMLSAAMSPCQVPGLEGFSFLMENGYYDSSDEANPAGLKFPQGYTRQETDMLWKGIWFGNVLLKAPADWGFADGEERTSAGIENFIKDAAGISIVASANNLLGIEKGEVEGFAISIDRINLNIIRGEFKEVKVAGRMGLPILPDDSYLDYEGIVDRTPVENGKENNKGANDAAAEALSMRFVVQPNEEGYDLDWIKSHIDFEESSQFLLKNDSKQRGFAATMSGSLTVKSSMDGINDQRDAGMPDIDLPGLAFEGLEISRMIDKAVTTGQQQNSGKSSTGGFTFKRPTFSFLGFNVADIGDAADQQAIPDAADPADEPEQDVDPKVNGFSINIDQVGFTFGADGDRSDETEITNGTQVNLSIGATIMLVGGKKKGSKSKKNQGFAISGTGGLTIEALVQKEGNSMTFAYQRFRMDSLAVDAKVSAIGIKGRVAFYQEDPKFGSGALGNLDIELPMINIGLDARFGSVDDYNYWYLFGDVKMGSGKARVPIATFQNIVSIYGFNGGAYYHMTNTGSGSPETRYSPSKDVLLGLEAGITLAVTRPEVLWGNITFGAEFNTSGGLNLISLRGSTYLLKSEMVERNRDTDPNVEGIEAFLDARINFKGEDTEFNAKMEIYANVAGGVMQGNMKNGQPYQIVASTMHISKEDWHLYIGSPSQRGSVRLGVPGIDIALTAQAYLMMGNSSLPTAQLPTRITSLLHKVNKDFSGAVSATNKNTRNGGGFVFGASLEYELNVKASILYADLYAGFGFDLSLLEYQGVTCSNNGGKAIGVDGWYASGQLYAGLEGDIGLDIDIAIYEGKISLASMGAVMLLEGGFPNPVFVRGTAGMYYSVLGGIVSGTTSFQVEVGESCAANIVDPFAGINFIADLDPDASQGRVSVFVKPQFTLNQRLGIYKIKVPTASGGQRTEEFKVEVKSFKILNSSKQVVVNKSDMEYPDQLTRRLVPDVMLQPRSTYYVEVELHGFRKENGKWVTLKDKDGKVWSEKESNRFVTGDRPNRVTLNNVKVTYPFINESAYLHGMNYLRKGLIQLIAPVDYLWKSKANPKDEWTDVIKVKFYNQKSKQLLYTGNLVQKKGRVLEFEMPSSLPTEIVIRTEIVRTYVKNPKYVNTAKKVANTYSSSSAGNYIIKREGVEYSNYFSKIPPDVKLFSYFFATSKYTTMGQKLRSGKQESLSVSYGDINGTSRQTATMTIPTENFTPTELGTKYIRESGSKQRGYLTMEQDYSSGYYRKIMDDHWQPYFDLERKLLPIYDNIIMDRKNPDVGAIIRALEALDKKIGIRGAMEDVTSRKVNQLPKDIFVWSDNLMGNLRSFRAAAGIKEYNFGKARIEAYLPAIAQYDYYRLKTIYNGMSKSTAVLVVDFALSQRLKAVVTSNKYAQTVVWGAEMKMTFKYWRPWRKDSNTVVHNYYTYHKTFK